MQHYHEDLVQYNPPNRYPSKIKLTLHIGCHICYRALTPSTIGHILYCMIHAYSRLSTRTGLDIALLSKAAERVRWQASLACPIWKRSPSSKSKKDPAGSSLGGVKLRLDKVAEIVFVAGGKSGIQATVVAVTRYIESRHSERLCQGR